MKVLHIVGGIGREGGGPSRSCQGLVASLFEADVDAWLYSFDNLDPWVKGVRKYCPPSKSLIQRDIKDFDLVHIHGVWSGRLHRVAKLCRRAKVPYVIAPRGMLEPWSLKQKWLKKRVARFLYQDRDLKKAAALHATAESEAEQFRKLGFKNYCIVSPNGVNLPSDEVKRKGEGEQRRALFVSRMHPKKGVMELVEAWARVRDEAKEKDQGERWCVELVYTKNGEEEQEYETKVKARVKELGLENQFIFTGPLDDDAKWEAYARADLFILPTYSENFGIVIAEALWAGVPVITTKGTPWSDLVSHNCGWWIDTGVDALESCLRSTLITPASTLATMGVKGHVLVEQKYTWKAVVGAMKHGYEKLLSKEEGL